MYAQCPECLTVYKLRADLLAQGRGRAACGSCAAEFDLYATLVDELPQGGFSSLKRRSPGSEIPRLNVPALRPQAEQRELFVDFDRTLRADRADAPWFAHDGSRRAASLQREWRWPLAGAALALLLAAQFAWAERARLLAMPRVHEFAQAACERLGCVLPAVDDRSRIALMARDVRPHPSVQHALIISATLANQAPFAQSYPVVEITLSDVDQRRIAMRRLRPDEYLGDTAAIRRGFGAGATTTFSLEVEDPGRDAVAFEFRFL
jgi:predicted Zn finger-like uncharacterized protein